MSTKTKKPKMTLQHVTFNLKGVQVRHDTMEGREYLVVPMVMMTEGVHNGSNGPLYYPAEEFEKTPAAWNHKPIVVYHPEINGQGVSACDPIILTAQKVGVIMNTEWDGKLKAEAWLEESRIAAVDDRISQAIENGQMMELSTGLFTDNEITEGEWNGEEYSYIARNYRPDHLALLPDRKGACSIADGAGFLRLNERIKDDPKKFNELLELVRNDLSHNEVNRQLYVYLDDQFGRNNYTENGEYHYIDEVYGSYFIYNRNGKLFLLNYSTSKNKVTVSGDPESVTRVTSYRKADGSLVGNAASLQLKDTAMDKKAFVDAMIANADSAWNETDRDFLMTKDEKDLQRLAGVKTTADANAEAVANAAKKGGSEIAPITNATPATPKVPTVADYINNAPPEFRGVLSQSLIAHNQAKATAIQRIMASPVKVFNKEFLESKELPELEGLAAYAAATMPNQDQFANSNSPGMFHPNYLGASTPAGGATFNEDEEPLALPSMDFSSK